MKTKLTKILGVALTVALLSSLLVFAAPTPVSAGTLSWTPVGIPMLTSNNIVAATTDVGPVVIGPDGTMYAARNDATLANGPAIFRSPNGGFLWIPCGGLAGTAAGDVVVDLEVGNNGDVFVAVQTPAGGPGTGIVFRSTNAGASFGQLGVVTLGAGEVITSMTVSPSYDGVGIIAVGIADVATATVPAVAGTCVQVWGDLGVLNWTNAGPAAACDVIALTFSPNYPADNTMLAVTALAGAAVQLRAILGGAWTWDPAAQYATPVAVTSASLDFLAVGAAGSTNDTLAADIALPYDFNGTQAPFRNSFVSIVSENVAVTHTNVYRINNLMPGIALGPGVVLWDLDFAGNYSGSDNLLMGGLFTRAAANLDVYYCNNFRDPAGSVLFYPSTNRPSGDTIAGFPVAAGDGLNMLSSAHIDMADDFLTSGLCVVGTVGNDSAFGATTNKGVCWNERGLIDNNNAALTFPAGSNVAIAPEDANTMFMSSTSSVVGTDVTDTNIWKTSDGGATWERVMCMNFTTAGNAVFAVSETYSADGICYCGDTGSTNLYYTATQGQCWELRTITAVIAVAIADIYAKGNTVYVADSNAAGGYAVGKSINGGWTWPLNLSPATPATAAMVSLDIDGDVIVVGTANSSVYRSGDDNVTWGQVGTAIVGAVNTFVGVRGDQIYAQLAAGGGAGVVYRWTFGLSPVWYPVSAAATWPALTGGVATVAPTAGVGLIITPDNTLYAIDPTASVVAGGPDVLYRSISPEFGPYAPLSFFEYVTGMAGGTVVRSMDVGSADTDAGNAVVILDGTTNTCWSYGDTLSAGTPGPTQVGPADATALDMANIANLMVENALGVTNYNFWISNDPSIVNNVNVASNQVPPATLVTVALPVAGVTVEAPVYWKARATGPIRGPWSDTSSVIPQPVAAPNAPGALNVAIDDNGRASILPVLSWSAFHSATGYQIQIAEGTSEIGFDTPLVDETLGVTTSYVVTTALSYDTAYAFRVRALVSGGTTDWSASLGFRTENAPVEVWTCPQCGLTFGSEAELEAHIATAHAPTTPLYIWIVIAVGAILVIAVIWLIFSTRRS